MKSPADVSRSARATRRSNEDNDGHFRTTTPSTPQQDFQADQIIKTPWADESFDDEHFMSPSSIPGGSSWESQSFDDEDRGAGGRPDSRTAAMRDRRKRFDTTTPTLIDEEEPGDEIGDEDVLELASTSAALDLSRDDSLGLSIDGASLRRTPGAFQMHQSAAAGSQQEGADSTNDEERSVPVLAFGSLRTGQSGNTGKWHALPDSVESRVGREGPTSSQNNNVEEGQSNRPPLGTGEGAARSEARGPFSFAPWAKSSLAPTSENRHGAFSPNILRLTEDIGNLLHEDEDDDFAIEIPSVFRGGDGEDSGTAAAEFGGDWTGSYVFDNKFGNKARGGAVQRPSTVIKDGRVRRRSNNNQAAGGGFAATPGGPTSSFFPVAMQPKPRRSGNEVFEFGKQGTDRPAPQLLNFGGAFVPPSKDPQGSFMRPVASAPAGSFAPQPFQHPAQPPAASVSEGPIFGVPPPAFESYQPPQQQTGPPVPPSFGPGFQFGAGSASQPPPSLMPPPQPPAGVHYQGQQASEMHATAQEFIPMSTRSPTPQFVSPQQQQPQWQPPINFEPPPRAMMEGNWHPPAPTPTNYHVNTGYNVPQPVFTGDTARAAMTPSPHVQAWQPPPPDPNLYGVPPSTPVEMVAPSSGFSQSPAPSSMSAPSPDITQGGRTKKNANRNSRRNKKKTKADKTPSSGANKKKGKEPPRVGSASIASPDGASDETVVSVSEDPMEAKKAELEETPATRIAFKDFYRAFRVEERHSFQKAEALAQEALKDGSLPESIHWRVYLELADLARRSNRYVESRKLYQKVCQLQPFASQGWLEYSKLEEDCGFMNRVSNILHAGLEYCEYSETLLTRAVKHQEKMGNLSSARGILARLKHVGIDKVWRTVLEGALLEARAGNHDMARRVLKYLMHHVPWYGPLYLEAYKLERDQGHPMDAMHIVERGLTTLPRYGPLWFGAFRLYEEMDVTERQFHLPRTMHMIERAKSTISKELVWKLHLEAAHMLERTALAYVEESGLDLVSYLTPVRRRLVLTILTCPQNLRWKVWLAAGRMELVVGNSEMAHSLFQRAHFCVQQKSKSATLLDCARLAEFNGDIKLARGILTKARSFYCSDWKVWFESVLVEIRNNNHARGCEIAARGLELHTGSGRLWATLVQLGQLVGGDEMQTTALERALSAVPKSGEVWCEGARIHLNPFSCTFDLHRSRRYLHFAARFTPQFGDSFIESIRLEVLSQWLYPIARYIWKKTRGFFNHDETSNNGLGEYIEDVCLAITVARRESGGSDKTKEVPETKFREIVSTLRKKLQADNLRSSIDLTDLRLACTNADPNYGSLWFHCRRLPMYTPRRVIEHAAEDIADEIFKYANIYLAAMIRRMAVLATVEQEMPQGAENAIETSDPAIVNWENYIDKELRHAISLEEVMEREGPRAGLVLLESAMQGSCFITGLSELNRYRPLESMTLLERRRALFGTDALFP
eukprot:CAMPEP_0172446234 /NCGR_PEP_ID=MMETSP1065-20121228/5875_1 /TAXON_ID=265537 /ORGANISM="Amphiprora paludosa, Strain CCMP125" /LENGTH=1464 /DNA_ID=CAMNT_0013197299 /DNA_START=166 /DNA_END=4560 /DNA_ORIENTATION=+